MNEFPIYTVEGKLFCKCQSGDEGDAILVCKNGRIPFRQLASKVYHPESADVVREKRTSCYKCNKAS